MAQNLFSCWLGRKAGVTVKPLERKLPADELRLILCDTRRDVVDAWIDHFRDLPAVEIRHGSLLEVSCGALVSPANSFGDMSGGVDQWIDRHYRGAAQREVVRRIREEFFGELPVGAALIVDTEEARLPLIAVAPTMRTPGNVANTLNAYLAMRAALVTVCRYAQSNPAPIRRLAVPGLCTGVGGMHPGLAARQMRAAYDNVIGGEWEEIVHPAMAPFALGQAGGKRWVFPERER